MAAGMMIAPGSKYLCAKPCKHTDCADNREQLALPCQTCNQLIKPGEFYYIRQVASGKVASQVHSYHEAFEADPQPATSTSPRH